MQRRKIIAGNWKMYKDASDADITIASIANGLDKSPLCDIWIAPPVIYLQTLIEKYSPVNIKFGAQNCNQAKEGAYTGEISAVMLKSINCTFVILGHSERRQYYFETDKIIQTKIAIALENNLLPIYCCGETLEQRNAHTHFSTVEKQIEEALFIFNKEQIQNIIIAYEPVWAIGTGVTASPQQAQEMHAYIRSLLLKKFGSETALSARILYGGSVKPNNAKEIFTQQDIDGGLIGGASLVAKDFLEIIYSL